ncbi:MAG: T9SS type A sorting domain-containing protein [Bacteroidales bacterium]|nr:T9SS type A sorting domain-containing protein [Bacteroidales bacterium]
MKNFIHIIFVFSLYNLFAQGELVVKHFTGSGQNQPQFIVRDNAGNIYVAGNFNGTINHDGTQLTSRGLQDVFIVKYNSAGVLQWIKQIGGTGTEAVYGLSLSPNLQYLAVGITFNGTTQIESTYLTATNNDIAIAIYNISGSLENAFIVAGGSGNQAGGHICFDANNHILITGIFMDNVEICGGQEKFSSTNGVSRQNFIAKVTKEGNVVWAKMLEGNSNITYSRSISSDNNGNVYISGHFTGYINIDDITLSTSNIQDGFLIKLNSSGYAQWGRRILGGSNKVWLYRHNTDQDGNMFCVGYFYCSQLTLDSTASQQSLLRPSNSNSGYSDIFICKYNSNGVLQWVKNYGSNGNDFLYGINANSNYFSAAGAYGGNIQLGAYNLTLQGVTDAMIIIGNSNNGSILNAEAVKGAQGDINWESVVSTTGKNFCFTGEFYSSSVTFKTTTLTNAFTNRDGYYAVYGCRIESISFTDSKVTCPGGSDGSITANPSPSGTYTYLWSTGEQTQTITNKNAGTYYVTVTDQYGCTLTSSHNLTENPPLQSTYSKVDPCGGYNGSATALPYDGKTPYTYKWSTGATTQTINNLGAGTYYCTIRDACLTTYVITVTLTNPPAFTSVTISTTPQSACIANGTATATPVGGKAPYTFLWNTGATTQTITNLAQGTYTCTVTDACNVTRSSSGNVGKKSIILPQPTTTCTQRNSCTGTATANPSGGDPPFSYLWDSNANNQTTQTAVNLCYRTTGYKVTVTDSYGCTRSATSYAVSYCSKSTLFDDEDNEILVFPNPAKDYIYIFVLSEINEYKEVSLFSLDGRCVYSQYLYPETNEVIINTSTFADGLYMLKLKKEEDDRIIKFYIRKD